MAETHSVAKKEFIGSELESEKLIQVIDKDGTFREPSVLNEKVKVWDFLNVGFDYTTVAILGCQSSGKSTLLNMLFNTHFAVMEATQGRTQTTLGVWLGHSILERNNKKNTILVFDIEGVDSRERGEEESGFEKKTSLFSLALAEVLIINMWHTDIGRYNAGNIALLKTVFELNLQLFAKENQKTTILFIIRDHLPDTPLDRLQETLMIEMNKIWNGLIKPESAKSKSVTDYFQFLFTALPHKILKPDEFKQEVGRLRERFFDANNPQFIFTRKQHDIPSDGFTFYAQHLWETITSNKDLDLPSEKEMLAMFRCDELQEISFRNFCKDFAPIKESLRKGQVIEKLGEKGTTLFKKALKEYDDPASRYHAEVAKRKREGLVFNMNSEFQPVFTNQILKLVQQATKLYETSFEKQMPKGKAVRDFVGITKHIKEETLNAFQKNASESVFETGSEWPFEDELQELETKIDKHIEFLRNEQLAALMEEMKNLFRTKWSGQLDKLLENASDEMWPEIRKMYAKSTEDAEKELLERLNGFQSDSQEREKKLEELKSVGFNLLRSKFQETGKQLGYIMLKKFESKFNIDSQGLPRRWKQTDNIAEYLLEARKSAEGMLEQFAVLRMSPELDQIKYLEFEDTDKIDPEWIVLTFDEAKNIKEKFLESTNSIYLHALRDQESLTTTAHVPVYLILLLIILGWNEFWHIITNPFLMFVLLIMGAIGYIIYLLNLGGYAKQVASLFLQTSLNGVQNVIQDLMQSPVGPPPVTSEKKNQ